ncbi:MAG: glycosyltransferase [Deltaproteobacteria bacterium]|nr:glycosyltransferase [Deltaproteobacteria bacterium]
MKILIAGDWHSQIHEEPVFQAFKKLGHETFRFSWYQYFRISSNQSLKCMPRDVFYKFQRKYIIGPTIQKINSDFYRKVEEIKPQFIFIYRGTHIWAKTIQKIKVNHPKILIAGYNNDDPFSKLYPAFLSRHYLKALSVYDWIFAYRQKNMLEYKKLGYSNVSLLRSYFIKEKNYPVSDLQTQRYKTDVIFAGHYEDDGRDSFVKAVLDAGIKFKLFGPEWERSQYYQYFINKLKIIPYLTDDYNLALNSAKIALVFLSKLNNDTYTRRCFEITAAKTFMLSQYTDDLDSMFKEGAEAEYFRDKEEMIDKIRYYLKHNDKREKIARAGYERLLRDGHEVADRAGEILKTYRKHFE